MHPCRTSTTITTTLSSLAVFLLRRFGSTLHRTRRWLYVPLSVVDRHEARHDHQTKLDQQSDDNDSDGDGDSDSSSGGREGGRYGDQDGGAAMSSEDDFIVDG